MREIKIGIIIPMNIPQIEEIVNAFLDHVKRSYNQKINFIIMDSKNDSQEKIIIIKKIMCLNVDIVFSIGTLTTDLTVRLIKNKPIICITDDTYPLEREIFSIRDNISVATRVKFIISAFLKLEEVIVIYNASSKNKVSKARSIKEEFNRYSISVKMIGINKNYEAKVILHNINKGRTQSIFLFKDELAISKFSDIYKYAKEGNIPIIASDHETVRNGAHFAIAIEERTMGRVAGKAAVSIITGSNNIEEEDMSIDFQKKNLTFVR